MRFGERLPNLFGEGEMTAWFHLLCAAYRRPQSILDALNEQPAVEVPDREMLQQAARASLASPHISRIDGAEYSPTGQARCRSCHELIARGGWRIRIAYYENGRFFPGGFVHLGCREGYFGGQGVLDQLLHFSPALSEAEREDLKRAY